MPLFGLFIRSNTTRRTDPAHAQAHEETDALAAAITTAGMAGPASIALRIMRPVSWIGGQFLWVIQPLLGTLGMRHTQNPLSLPGLATLFEREEAVDDLISRLDNAPNERRT